MTPATHALKDTVRNDTFNKVDFTITKDNVAIDLTNATIKVAFRHLKKDGKVSKALTNADGITLTTPAQGKFKIDAFIADMPVGIHYYDIEITIGTVVKTYIEGTINITQDVA